MQGHKSAVFRVIINMNHYLLMKDIYLSYRDEAVRQSATPMTKSSLEMENHVFMKAKSRVSLEN